MEFGGSESNKVYIQIYIKTKNLFRSHGCIYECIITPNKTSGMKNFTELQKWWSSEDNSGIMFHISQ